MNIHSHPRPSALLTRKCADLGKSYPPFSIWCDRRRVQTRTSLRLLMTFIYCYNLFNIENNEIPLEYTIQRISDDSTIPIHRNFPAYLKLNSVMAKQESIFCTHIYYPREQLESINNHYNHPYIPYITSRYTTFCHSALLYLLCD